MKNRIISYRSFIYYFTLISFGIYVNIATVYAQSASITAAESPYFSKGQDTTYIRTLLNKGVKLQSNSVENAKHYFNEAYSLCRGQMPTAVKADACAYLARQYWDKAQSDSCIAFCDEAINIEMALHRENRLLYLYDLKSRAYSEKSSFHMAILSIYSALALVKKNERLRHSEHVPRIYEAMATLWSDLGEAKQRNAYLDTAFMLSQNIKDTFSKISILAHKGFHAKDSADRNSQLRTALEMSRLSNCKVLESICLTNLGAVATDNGKIEDAFDYLNKALRIRNNLETVSGGLQLAPNFYLARAYFKNRQYTLAEGLLKEIITKGELIQHATALRHAHELLSKVYAANHNYEAAYKHSEIYKGLLDTTIRMEKEKTVEFLLQYQSL